MMFFVLIVMLPTIVAGGVVQRVVIGEEKKRVQLALQPALTSVLSYYEGRAPLVEAMVRATAGSPGGLERLIAGGTGAEIRRFLEKRLRGDAGDVDFLLALVKQGRPRSYST